MTTITFVEAPPGNGKSLYAVKKAFQVLEKGGVIGLNFPLVENWSVKLAERNLPLSADHERKYKLAHSYWERAFSYGTVDSLYEMSTLLPFLVSGKMGKRREGQGLVLFDEASLLFNARDWKKNFEYIQFFINSRKLKWECILMSHSHQDVDVQIQRKCELLKSVRCMTKRKFLGFNIECLFKIPRFRLISTVSGAGAGKGQSEDKYWFKLPLKYCDLYDTDHRFSFDDFKKGLGKLGDDPKILYEKQRLEKSHKAFMRFNAATVLY